MHGVVLIIDSACHSRAVRCLGVRTRLVGWVGRAGGLLVVLAGLGTLRTGGDMPIVRVTLLFISVWGMGTPVVVFTLGTCCPRGVSVGVAACLNHLGCAFMCACVLSTMRWRSFVAGEVLLLTVVLWMALTQLANACITVSTCMMEGLVMRVCWNCTVSDRCSLLVCLT